MLDTDTVSYFVKGRFSSIQDRMLALDSSEYCISVITRSEILFGLHLASTSSRSQIVARQFLAHVQTLDWGRREADIHARIRAQLRKAGIPMSDMDLLIAVHAISIGATLVTNNIRHHGRLEPELTIENWVTES
jgi:tRNA(fMet)-specific endonuclease VapC